MSTSATNLSLGLEENSNSWTLRCDLDGDLENLPAPLFIILLGLRHISTLRTVPRLGGEKNRVLEKKKETERTRGRARRRREDYWEDGKKMRENEGGQGKKGKKRSCDVINGFET